MSRVSKHKQYLAKIALLTVEDNKRCKNIRQIKENKVFQLWQKEENDFWDKYESDFIRDSISDESSSDGKEEEVNNTHKRKYKETGICEPGLSVFYSGLGDYLCTVRETSSFLTKKRERRELEKATSNSVSFKTIFKTERLCIF